MNDFQERLRSLTPELLNGLRRGIEKESLRVDPDGRLSSTPHPEALGSPLTHPNITTDFSESQLELITGVHTSVEACLEELTRIHQYVYRHIGEEVLWAASMPCGLPEDDAIPLGRYGTSNAGRLKSVYRMGLAHRYGRRMQTISGVHYNFSLPDAAWRELPWACDRNAAYFALLRNFRRHAWLLLYLLGASPAVCTSFVAGRAHRLQELKRGTLYLPHGTTLRMGPLGYQSNAQASLAVSYNSLESYAATLQEALTRPYPAYQAIGLREGDQYRQLATTLLQIENEFYGKIRPKRPTRPHERPLHALRQRGVEYVEVRLLDLDPFCPIGISAPTIRMLDVFLLHCLLTDSPPDTPQEILALGRNQNRVAGRGREPGLELERAGATIALRDWGGQLLAECEPIAAALDAAQGGRAHRDALAAALAALSDPARVPSARVLEDMARDHDDSYTRFALSQSLQHARALRALPLSPAAEAAFHRAAQESRARQREMEAADTVPFETYRQRYLAHDLLQAWRAADPREQ